MGDIKDGAWFHTREGERIGPVSYADLRIKARDSGLDPRLAVVWTRGMSGWKPSGEVAGLFDRVDPVNTRRTLPVPSERELVEEQGANQNVWPGARRRSYLFVTFLLPFLISFVTGLAMPFLTLRFGEETTGRIALGMLILPIPFMIYYAFLRLVNLEMSRWWMIGYLIPPLNLWVGYRCVACPAGYVSHRKMDSIGILLAVIYWLVALLALLAIVAGVAVMTGVMGSSELQQQFQDVLRTSTVPQP